MESPPPGVEDHSAVAGDDDDDVRAVVRRLSRRHASGGTVIERAAVLASGGDTGRVLRWIVEHGGSAEELAAVPSGRGGMYGARGGDRSADPRKPLRYVLPPGV